MLRLRLYNKDDAETILTWIKDGKAFYKWTAGILGEYLPKKRRKSGKFNLCKICTNCG